MSDWEPGWIEVLQDDVFEGQLDPPLWACEVCGVVSVGEREAEHCVVCLVIAKQLPELAAALRQTARAKAEALS